MFVGHETEFLEERRGTGGRKEGTSKVFPNGGDEADMIAICS